MKVLITMKSARQLESPGGVGSYYYSLEQHFPDNIIYFRYSHVESRSLLRKLYKRITDSFFYFKICLGKHPKFDLIQLNPSLSWASLIRDGILLLMAVLSGKKTIVFFRGWHQNMVFRLNNSRLLLMLFKVTFSKADAHIVLARDFRDQLRKWGINIPVYVESTVVDNQLFHGDKSHMEKKPSKVLRLLFLARIEKYKGIYELLEACRLVKNQYPHIQLVIAGSGSELENMKIRADEILPGSVIFKGYLTGMAKAKVLLDSDVYILPSHGEGMPNSVLEAMAFGLPVITRKVGGLMDFFEDGRMGYFTQSTDPAVFAELILSLIKNPSERKKMSEFNSGYAKKWFSSHVVAKRLQDIQQQVMHGHARDGFWLSDDGGNHYPLLSPDAHA